MLQPFQGDHIVIRQLLMRSSLSKDAAALGAAQEQLSETQCRGLENPSNLGEFATPQKSH